MNFELLVTPEHSLPHYRMHLSSETLRVLDRYKDEMESLIEYCPGIILAGGAVRDTYFNRPVKDWDFFSVHEQDIYNLGKALDRPLLDCLRNLPANERTYEAEGSLLAAFETEEKDVNLLLVTSVMERIKDFPDTLSQIWFDGKDVYCTPAFAQTALTERVQYRPSMETSGRLERLQGKYPDFTFDPVL